MTETSNVVDGSATISINTSGMEDGIYKVLTEYPQNYNYKRSTNESNLILQQQPAWTKIADISSTSTEWTQTPSGSTITVNNSYNVWKQNIPDGTLLQITGSKSGTSPAPLIDFRDKITSNSASLSIHNSYLSKWGGAGSGSAGNVTWANGDFVITVERNNGVFIFTINNETPVTVNLNKTVFNDNCYVAFMRENNNTSFTITDVRYK